MDIKRKTYDSNPEKNSFLDITSINIDTLVPSLYQCRCLSYFQISISSSLSSAKCLPQRWSFSVPNRWSHQRPSLGCNVDVQEVPIVVPEFSPGCLGCMGSGIVMMKQYPSCHLAWMFSANFILIHQQTSQRNAEFTFSPLF
jgi:hypothetical protein